MARSSLEDFVLESTLGTGSFGIVHKALRKHDGKYYALKEIDLRCQSEKEQEDCIKECAVLAGLDSPFIVKFYDSFLEKGKLFICMEYAAGGNLYDHIRQQPAQLPEERIWQLSIQMLLGLNYMHARKILHRDFKTANVFLDKECNVRLGDLGVAKVLSDQTLNAQTMIGTPYYLSPEMCEDKPYNEKSDVWALGVALYECCAKRHPFDGENQGSLILKILRGKYPPVTGYSKQLTDIVKACLTLDASKRPGTKSLLALESVREHAKQLHLEMPPVPASKPLSPSPPPLPRPSIAASKAPSRRVRDAAGAPLGQQPPLAAGQLSTSSSRSVTPPPPVNCSPSAVSRVPASLLKVDISAGLPAVSTSRGSCTPPVGASANRRRTTTDDAPRAPSPAVAPVVRRGQSQRQLQVAKRAASPVQGCRPTMDTASAAAAAASEPPTQRNAGCSSQAADVGAGSSLEAVQPVLGGCQDNTSSTNNSSGSQDNTSPLPTDRSHRLQHSLPNVRTQLIELVGPLAFDALHAMILDRVQTDDPVATLSSSKQCAGDAQEPHDEPSQVSLAAAMQHIVSAAQVPAVLPLLVKLLYLEAQVGDADLLAAEPDS